MARENAPGWLVTFEGGDGSGKSTQTKLLAEHLSGLGCDVLLTREPGGTGIGEQIRDVLHDLRNREMLPRTEVLGYQMARAQLVGEKIRPCLLSGGVVVSDRYADSTLAYQGYGHRMDLVELGKVIRFATEGLLPNLTFLLDITVEEGLRRRAGSGGWNRLDDMSREFHERVRKGYLEMASQEPDRWIVLSADQEVEALHRQVRCIAVAHLGIDKVK